MVSVLNYGQVRIGHEAEEDEQASGETPQAGEKAA